MGSQRRVTPKKKIRRRARRKFGMQMPNSEKRLPAPSRGELRRAAERMPMGNATTSEIAMARAASWRLGRMRRPTFSITGSRLRMDWPRSPWRIRPIQCAYCSASGRSRPRSRRSVSFTPASTDSAIIASIGSPGVRWISMNTPAETRNSTGMVATIRCRISCHMERGRVLLEPHLAEPHHPVRHRIVALHPGAEGLGLDGVHDEEHGQLVLQQPDQLAEELLAVGLARRLAGLVENGV